MDKPGVHLMPSHETERPAPPEMILLFPGAVEVVGEPPTDWLAPFRTAALAIGQRLKRR